MKDPLSPALPVWPITRAPHHLIDSVDLTIALFAEYADVVSVWRGRRIRAIRNVI
jgi:hypothetical protein